MKICVIKTKIMIENKKVELVQEFVYLGSVFIKTGVH